MFSSTISASIERWLLFLPMAVHDHVDDLVAAVGFDRRRRVFASLKLKGCLLMLSQASISVVKICYLTTIALV